MGYPLRIDRRQSGCFAWPSSQKLDCFTETEENIRWLSLDLMKVTRPGKRLHNWWERSTMLLMGKSTISTGPFSIANCWHNQRVLFLFWWISVSFLGSDDRWILEQQIQRFQPKVKMRKSHGCSVFGAVWRISYGISMYIPLKPPKNH